MIYRSMQVGQGMRNYPINTARFTPQGPLACQAKCASTTDCRFFSFNRDSQKCNLQRASEAFPNKNAIAGPKECVESEWRAHAREAH